MLAELKDLLSQHITQTLTFQNEVSIDIKNLKDDIMYLALVIDRLEGSLRAPLVSSPGNRAKVNLTKLIKLSEENREQVKKQMDTIRSLHWNLLHHVEEVDSQVNLLTGSWECAGTHGWRRVGYFNMSNPTSSCPPGWRVQEVSGKRLCGRSGLSPNECDSTLFSVNDVMYSKVCGRIIGYQFGGTTAFLNYHREFVPSINDAYVDGISITHSMPRKHIWTFAAGGTELDRSWPTSCPCDATIDISLPKFLGQDFFCESGLNHEWEGKYEFYPDDLLWDGEGCTANSTCCEFRNPPYFVKKLNTPTSENIEVRLCGYTTPTYGSVLIELLELYVQ